jgi:predicted ATPase/DNA-binding winged helix-turn-helix (wHTH) protein
MDLPSEPAAGVAFGRFLALPYRRELWADGQPIKLGGRAFDVLLALIEAQGTVVSKGALMARVWPGRIIEDNSLEAQISALRAAFGAERGLIRTVSGRGYQFTGDIGGMAVGLGEPHGAAAAQSAAVLPPTNIPEPASGLIGRDAEVAAILSLIGKHRLVTLAGAGGIGKTRLALAVARRLRPQFPDGVWLAEFSPLADANLVPATVAAAVGLQPSAGEISPQCVSRELADRQLLLILDTCEHVIEATAAMAEALLQAATGVRILVTSREPLRAEGEQIYPVPPLAVPAVEGEDPWQFGAVRLFAARSRASGAQVGEDQHVARMIAGICRQLDGIPLALELAAARAATLGVEGLIAGLDDRFHLLTGGRRTALPRHQTLRATLDWSYELLTEPERVVLRRLAVFAGLFNLVGACAVVASPEISPSQVVDRLSDLVNKSLVVAEVEGSPVRYRLLDTTRAYALEKLDESGERERLLRSHAGYYRDLFAPAEAESEARPQAEWLAIYGRYIDDVRASLDWAFSPDGDRQIGVALTIAAVALWVQLSLLGECRKRAERALEALDHSDPMMLRQRMQLSAALGWSLMYGVGRAREAGPAWATTLRLADSLDDRDYRLRALWGLGIDQFNNGEFCTALGYARRFAALVENSTDAIELIMGDRILATALHYIGDQRSARHHVDRALMRLDEIGQQPQIVRLRFDMRISTHYFQARILWLQGFADRALSVVKHNIEEGRAIGHALTFCSVLGQAACPISFLAGDLDTAAHYGAMLVQHTERHPIRLWHLWARCFNGLVAVKRADAGGLEMLRRRLEEAGDAGLLPRFLLLHGELALGLGEAGDGGQGLTIIEETLARCETRDERWYLAELLRIRGELLLLRGEPGAAAAEDHFQQALALARRQGALFWELRAATSLARLLSDRGRSADATALLQPVYHQFTEGFATADLKAARVLLDDLS